MTKPTFTLLMNKLGNALTWVVLEPDEWLQVDNQPQKYQIYVVDGQKAKVLVATYDWSLKRSDALKVASMYVLGAYQEITINLKDLEGKIEAGKSPLELDTPPL